MGLYINGLEMPKETTLISIGPGGTVEIHRNDDLTWVPLKEKAVPVPPHGRLIDADELHSALRKRAKEFSNSEYGEGVKCGLADAREYIKIAPTILPTDPAEEVSK